MPQEDPDPIVEFYRGRPIGGARKIVDVWDWDFDTLESTHDFIQWLFPLDMPSDAVPGSPVATPDTVRAFHWDEVLRDRLQISFTLMLRFYGFERLVLPGGSLLIIRASSFPERYPHWLTMGNHNFLRLTRILRSLTLMGHRTEAKAFFARLDEVAREEGRGEVPLATIDHWQKAIQ